MDSIKLEKEFNVSAKTVYDAWLSSEGHTQMTGGEANSQTIEGTEYMAWDDYITGTHLELKPNSFIKQSWRSTEFEDADEDSIVEINLEDTSDGCVLKMHHYNIPKGQGKRYENGWVEHYFEPMESYFS
jgi:uncharacterized protein YndB with AHSA1/START domain